MKRSEMIQHIYNSLGDDLELDKTDRTLLAGYILDDLEKLGVRPPLGRITPTKIIDGEIYVKLTHWESEDND
jgi:hypothetical protein